jgi:sensor histidine kinase regulating citrate/malate metabolism
MLFPAIVSEVVSDGVKCVQIEVMDMFGLMAISSSGFETARQMAANEVRMQLLHRYSKREPVHYPHPIQHYVRLRVAIEQECWIYLNVDTTGIRFTHAEPARLGRQVYTDDTGVHLGDIALRTDEHGESR